MYRPVIPILCPLIQKRVALKPGKSVGRRKPGARSGFYKITMTPEQYLRIVIEQQGVNFAAPPFTPDDKKISETEGDYNLKFPADLATLSACKTGLGKGLKGEGPAGVARGFMRAGPRLLSQPSVKWAIVAPAN